MKKLIIVLMLWLGCFSLVKAQSYSTQMYIDWTLVGQPSWTTPSWFYCVTRSTHPDNNGRYWFDVWFMSNTYIWDYQNNRQSWRYVQISNCKVSFDGTVVNYGKGVDISFREGYTPSPLRGITRNKHPKIKFYWDKYYTL
jgi:hypothetical protein